MSKLRNLTTRPNSIIRDSASISLRSSSFDSVVNTTYAHPLLLLSSVECLGRTGKFGMMKTIKKEEQYCTMPKLTIDDDQVFI